MNEHEQTPEQIERDIEATRERMSRDIDELGDRLSPDSLKRQAKEAITGKAHEVVNNVGAGARRTGFRMMDFIQENTSLVAAMGLGAVWLIQQRNRSDGIRLRIAQHRKYMVIDATEKILRRTRRRLNRFLP